MFFHEIVFDSVENRDLIVNEINFDKTSASAVTYQIDFTMNRNLNFNLQKLPVAVSFYIKPIFVDSLWNVLDYESSFLVERVGERYSPKYLLRDFEQGINLDKFCGRFKLVTEVSLGHNG